MKRPSFQFYAGDWLRNANLRRCTLEERGAWMEIMCLMHDSDRYGVLQWPMREVAESIGAKLPVVVALVTKGVMKGVESGMCEPLIYVPTTKNRKNDPVTLIAAEPGPIWFSSRMVKDEHIRNAKGVRHDDES